jgi:hypothetical protein
MKYVYHIYARYEKYGVSPEGNAVVMTAISNTSTLLTTSHKIDNDEYFQVVRQALWNKVKNDVLPCFTIDKMVIHSLTFLHEVES